MTFYFWYILPIIYESYTFNVLSSVRLPYTPLSTLSEINSLTIGGSNTQAIEELSTKYLGRKSFICTYEVSGLLDNPERRQLCNMIVIAVNHCVIMVKF